MKSKLQRYFQLIKTKFFETRARWNTQKNTKNNEFNQTQDGLFFSEERA